MTTGLLVEKKLIKGGTTVPLYAAAFSQPNAATVKYSLTFEGYITEWTEDQAKAARLAAGEGI